MAKKKEKSRWHRVQFNMSPSQVNKLVALSLSLEGASRGALLKLGIEVLAVLTNEKNLDRFVSIKITPGGLLITKVESASELEENGS